MTIRTLQWNIGGALTRKHDADPVDDASYAHEDLDSIAGVIRDAGADIVTLQEVHGDGVRLQASEIAQRLGLAHVVYDVYAASHLVEGQSLGQAIISRYPILSHDFAWFFNPKITMTQENGQTWTMHDKGVTRCLLDVDGHLVEVETLHMPPFRRFAIDPLAPKWRALREDYARKLSSNTATVLIQGDFNFDQPTVADLLPDLVAAGLQEEPCEGPTSPYGKMYDHVLFKGLHLQSQCIITDARTDHFPIVSEFSL